MAIEPCRHWRTEKALENRMSQFIILVHCHGHNFFSFLRGGLNAPPPIFFILLYSCLATELMKGK